MKNFIYLSLFVVAFISSPALCQEKQKSIDINVACTFEPTHGVGLLLSETDTQQTDLIKISRVNPGTVVVRVPYDEQSLSRDSVATALVIGPDGTAAYGDIRPVFSPDSRDSYLSIPQCTPEKISETALQGQVSLLESLIEVRSARRGVAQVKTAQIMTGPFLENLNKLEQGFGFHYPNPLSSDLTPVELIDRLSRLAQVVASAKASR